MKLFFENRLNSSKNGEKIKTPINESYDDYYTHFIDEQVPNCISSFLNLDETTSVDEQYHLLKECYDVYLEDYKQFPDDRSWESLDSKYDRDKGRFYIKYRTFVDRCKELNKRLGISGYAGLRDLFAIKIREIYKKLDYNFPYGWKQYV